MPKPTSAPFFTEPRIVTVLPLSVGTPLSSMTSIVVCPTTYWETCG